MKSSETMKQLKELQQTYRKQDFCFSKEQQETYNQLLKQRRERVKYFYANGLVAKSTKKDEVI
jgi:hypothetical protein